MESFVGNAVRPQASWYWMAAGSPLILAAWHETPAMPKMLRLAEHIEWAERHGVLGPASRFLRELQEEEWFHIGD
jgi:hypothetical protein